MRIVKYRGKWCAEFRDEGGTRHRVSLGNLDVTAANYPAAQRAAADLEHQLARPVGNIISDVFEAYLKGTKAISRDTAITNCWKALKPFWGGLRVDQITRERCNEYAAQRRAKGRQDGTILKELNCLKAAVNWAGLSGAVWEMPSSPPPRDRWLTRTEFDRLLDAAVAVPHLAVFLHLAIATGARKEALLQLRWEQVNWAIGQIWLGRKPGGKNRATVPMTTTLRAVLQEAKAAARTDYVVEYADRPVLNIKKAFASAVKRAGLRDVTPHDLRHTAAVWMAERGVPMTKIAAFLGHTDSRITERVYARFAPDHLHDAAAAVDLGHRIKKVTFGSNEPKRTKAT